jgi:ATP-binding cassette subfamily B protein
LVKLLCRFYDPSSGRITFDGVDIRTLSLEQLRALISALFQDPVRHNATVEESISLGDQRTSASRGQIRSAAVSAGGDDFIEALPRGYETLLGKAFLEGEELSGGQWQRIALARALYRRAEILILDEPTSAMDPWAEADWLDYFRVAANGRTSLLITHRLTTAMRADLICVVADGEIVESGRHDQLIEGRGPYARTWERQLGADVPVARRSSELVSDQAGDLCI